MTLSSINAEEIIMTSLLKEIKADYHITVNVIGLLLIAGVEMAKAAFRRKA